MIFRSSDGVLLNAFSYAVSPPVKILYNLRTSLVSGSALKGYRGIFTYLSSGMTPTFRSVSFSFTE